MGKKQKKQAGFKDLGFAKVDTNRTLRTGVGEVVFGEGKTAKQIASICKALKDAGQQCVIVTRISPKKANKTKSFLAKASIPFSYNKLAKFGLCGKAQTPAKTAYVVVACAGTSDLYCAEEAAATIEALGTRVIRLFDIGVAGIHRLLAHEETIAKAACVVTVAGMDGALPSVVTGIARCPVIAVPTSVGYGASFKGVSALLAMLNSCATGMSVVNIDNGFGAGFQAHLIARQSAPTTEPASKNKVAAKTETECKQESESSPASAPAVKVKPKVESKENHDESANKNKNKNDNGKTARHSNEGVLFWNLTESATRKQILENTLQHLPNGSLEIIDELANFAGVPVKHNHNIAEVIDTINQLGITEEVRMHMLEIYDVLAHAEAAAHGVNVSEAHFHEVGDGEHILNTLVVCLAIHLLEPKKIVATPVQTGMGKIMCSHGEIDVPAPATKAIIKRGLCVCDAKLPGERLTPTSAAIIFHYVDEYINVE